MPKIAHYTEQERNFVLALALATKRPWTALEPLLRGLAERGSLAFLGPGANEKFRLWSPERGYQWQRKYGWELGDIDQAPAPLPREEEIDDQLLRDRMKVKEHFLTRLLNCTYDPYQTALALHRVTEQIEAQITRRMSRPMTPQTLIDLIMAIFRKFGDQKPDDVELLDAIAQEVTRYRYIPAPTAP